MHIFRNKSPGRQVRRGRQATQKDSDFFPTPSLPDSENLEAAKKKRWPKRLLIGTAGVIVLLLLVAVFGFYYIASTPLRGEAAGRINILVMGVDNSIGRSDTLMLISINTNDNKAAFISVPRDMYVSIPDYGDAKINAAYSYGRANGGKDGGVKLTQKTVESIFDITIHYYAVMDFKGLEGLVDVVGGIDVNIKSKLYDPEYPRPGYMGTKVFELPAGKHHLDGATALQVARCRKGTCGNDYGRADRQQQILVALKSNLLSSKIYLHKSKIDDIRDILDKHLITNISTREALKFAKIMRDLPDASVSRHVLDTSNYLVAIAGSSDLIPRTGQGNFSEIAQFIKNIFKQKGNNLPEAQQ